MTTDPHAIDAKVYNELVARAHLRNIRLTGNRFDLRPEALQLDPESWRHSIEGQVEECFLEPETGALYGIVAFGVSSRHARKRVLSATATYMVSYRIQGEGDAEACELFMDRVGKVAAYPYFRTLVATLVAGAGMNMPPLPIYSLAPRTLASAAGMEVVSDARRLTKG